MREIIEENDERDDPIQKESFPKIPINERDLN